MHIFKYIFRNVAFLLLLSVAKVKKQFNISLYLFIDVPLGGMCDCHSQCADDNAVCDPDTCKCVCADGYYDTNGDDVDGGNCTESEWK